MTSANFSGLLTPSPLGTILDQSAVLKSLVRIWATPSLPLPSDVIWEIHLGEMHIWDNCNVYSFSSMYVICLLGRGWGRWCLCIHTCCMNNVFDRRHRHARARHPFSQVRSHVSIFLYVARERRRINPLHFRNKRHKFLNQSVALGDHYERYQCPSFFLTRQTSAPAVMRQIPTAVSNKSNITPSSSRIRRFDL